MPVQIGELLSDVTLIWFPCPRASIALPTASDNRNGPFRLMPRMKS